MPEDFISQEQAMILQRLKERVDEHDSTLNRHDAAIAALKLTSEHLEKRQKEHEKAMGELSNDLGAVVREVSNFSRRLADTETKLLRTMIGVTDKLSALNEGFRSFKDSQKAFCKERHKAIDIRLSNAEKTDDRVRQEMDSFSDLSQSSAIEHLQGKIEELQEEAKRKDLEKVRQEQRTQHLEDTHRSKRFQLFVAVVSSLLAGAGGSALIKWLIS